MTNMPDNTQVDEYILANLPSSYGSLHKKASLHFGCEMDRKIDGRLQSLRKRHVVTWLRNGRDIQWIDIRNAAAKEGGEK